MSTFIIGNPQEHSCLQASAKPVTVSHLLAPCWEANAIGGPEPHQPWEYYPVAKANHVLLLRIAAVLAQGGGHSRYKGYLLTRRFRKPG